jgi:ferric-dicitrate binding protein FerR (iron transport regulator)
VSTVTLPDGSHVILAPQTSLVLDEKFLHGSRAVTLRGEAYFTVNANQSAPFIVHSGHVSTRVLGTTFDIKHYDEDRDVHVCVTAGKVLVSPVVPAASRLSPVVLFAGRAAQISDSTAVVTMIDGTNVSTAWTDGRLVFAGASVAEVLATVGRWYGYQFRISDTGLAQQHITATLEPSSAKDMLSVLRLALDVTMTFDGNVVTLYPNTTSAEPRRRRDLNAVPQPRTEVGR